MSHPPIKSGTRVKACVQRAGKGDYTASAIAARALYDGQSGVVGQHHDSHGLCYSVAFEDGGIAYFDPEELEVL